MLVKYFLILIMTPHHFGFSSRKNYLNNDFLLSYLTLPLSWQ